MCVAVLYNIPTGCKKIDEILEGGIPNRKISLIYGEAETGKTTLAMQCAVNCAFRGYKTLFVDCDGTFSARRLSQIASSDFKNIAESIILMKPGSFREQETIIERITDYITKSFGLIVIDTLTSLYRIRIADNPEKGFDLNRELNRQMACLAQTAKTRKITVLATSQVRSAFNGALVSIEPVANRVLRFWADVIVIMKPTGKPQIIKAIMEKTPKKAKPLACLLKIAEKGIHEYPTH
jgi:DNA repair protein RadB